MKEKSSPTVEGSRKIGSQEGVQTTESIDLDILILFPLTLHWLDEGCRLRLDEQRRFESFE